MTINFEVVNKTVKVTSDHTGVTRIIATPPKDFSFRVQQEVCYFKILSDAEETNITATFASDTIQVAGVTKANSTDFITAIGALINF